MSKPTDDTEFFWCAGFLFLNSRHQFEDPEDFLDFRTRRWTREALTCDLELGVLPNGMILKAHRFAPVVVLPESRGGGQRVVNMKEVL